MWSYLLCLSYQFVFKGVEGERRGWGSSPHTNPPTEQLTQKPRMFPLSLGYPCLIHHSPVVTSQFTNFLSLSQFFTSNKLHAFKNPHKWTPIFHSKQIPCTQINPINPLPILLTMHIIFNFRNIFPISIPTSIQTLHSHTPYPRNKLLYLFSVRMYCQYKLLSDARCMCATSYAVPHSRWLDIGSTRYIENMFSSRSPSILHSF